MKVIGITGKIGSGKSTVAQLLEKEGASRIDCDQVVHELYEPGGRGAEKIQQFFEEELLLKNGGVNRNKLTRILLKTPKKWEILNRIIHPIVAEELRKRLQQSNADLVALEIQIYTPRFAELIDELWIVETSKEARKKRLPERTQEEFNAINAQQEGLDLPSAKRITNNGSREELEQKIRSLV